MAILPGFVQKVKCMNEIQQNETYDTYIHEKLQDPTRKESTPQAHPASERKWLGQAVWRKCQLAGHG